MSEPGANRSVECCLVSYPIGLPYVKRSSTLRKAIGNQSDKMHVRRGFRHVAWRQRTRNWGSGSDFDTSPRGLSVVAFSGGDAVQPLRRLPFCCCHGLGWTVAIKLSGHVLFRDELFWFCILHNSERCIYPRASSERDSSHLARVPVQRNNLTTPEI